MLLQEWGKDSANGKSAGGRNVRIVAVNQGVLIEGDADGTHVVLADVDPRVDTAAMDGRKHQHRGGQEDPGGDHVVWSAPVQFAVGPCPTAFQSA